ncbi:MAG: thioredoxin [Clostridium butyricum]|nr:thioredoxin [Clostridium butyricum]
MKIVNSVEFKEEIKSGVVLVDFFATWCGPCKMLAPVLEQVSEEMAGKATVIKVDIDQCPDLADKFEIVSVPTMMVFKDNKKVDMLVGFLPKDRITQVIESHL